MAASPCTFSPTHCCSNVLNVHNRKLLFIPKRMHRSFWNFRPYDGDQWDCQICYPFPISGGELQILGSALSSKQVFIVNQRFLYILDVETLAVIHIRDISEQFQRIYMINRVHLIARGAKIHMISDQIFRSFDKNSKYNYRIITR